MEDTGRIRQPLNRLAQEIVFGNDVDLAVDEELPFFIRIDRAHLVMLCERGIVSPTAARRLLGAMDDLVARDYAPLRGRPAPRGLYLLYERYLIDLLGEQDGGALHIGRSRNDIKATVLRLRMRDHYSRLAREILRLLAVLIRRADRCAAVTMPIYTHHQAALPVTYGHYLSGVSLAIARDLRAIAAAASDLDRCPLGAGAGGGTSVPIDPERSARLLGFTEAVLHSVDAVASYDLVLRLLGAATIFGVTLSRLATDLQLWSTAEFDLLRFPDPLVGSSSIMPQKRNAFLLEHIKGRSGAPLGALTMAAMAMHATPFSNSVAVGTEGVRPVWRALGELREATILTRLMVRGAQPQPEAMYRRAVEGFTAATELANILALRANLPFRRAHYQVGEAVRHAIESGEPFESATEAVRGVYGLSVEAGRLEPAGVAEAAIFGGGPGRAPMERVLARLRRDWTCAARQLDDAARRWTESARALEAAVTSIRAAR